MPDMESNIQTTITPHNQNPFVTRTYPSENELDKLIANAVIAQKAWSAVSVEDRVTVGKKFMVVINSAPC
jgi:acyl-CoA reductase-like NAD-dependent aldehyde dehydrogenase